MFLGKRIKREVVGIFRKCLLFSFFKNRVLFVEKKYRLVIFFFYGSYFRDLSKLVWFYFRIWSRVTEEGRVGLVEGVYTIVF